MPRFIKHTFIVLVLLLLGFGGLSTTKCVSINNQPCMVRPKSVGFSPDELHYNLSIISLGRFDESCNTVDDPFGRICVPNEMEDTNFKTFNMIKRIYESETFLFCFGFFDKFYFVFK